MLAHSQSMPMTWFIAKTDSEDCGEAGDVIVM